MPCKCETRIMCDLPLLLILLVCISSPFVASADSHGDDTDVHKSEELAHFMSKDQDRDGRLNKAEFHALISHVVDDHGEASDGGINPEITGEDAEFFMKEFDIDGDGTVSHDEYVQKMYHDEPQQPVYQDGKLEEGNLEGMRRVFREGDADRDGFMSEHEAREMFKAADGTGGEAKLEEDQVGALLWHLMDDKDKDTDGKLSLDEWLHGGGY